MYEPKQVNEGKLDNYAIRNFPFLTLAPPCVSRRTHLLYSKQFSNHENEQEFYWGEQLLAEKVHDVPLNFSTLTVV